MNSLLAALRASPLKARVIPFAVFVALTLGQGFQFLGPSAPFWIYLAKTFVGAALVLAVWPAVAEMRWKFSGAAIASGVGVFALWVGLDPLLQTIGLPNSYPKLSNAGGVWNPLAQFPEQPTLVWLFIVTRVAGSSLVVPMLEEVFYRSFLYRYLQQVDFLSAPLGRFVATPFVVTSLIFGAAHREWLAGLLCGFCYQGLVCWKGRISDAIAAHAITNFLLGTWVVSRGAWQFW